MNKNISKIIDDLSFLSSISSEFNIQKEKVSLWSVSLHVDHVLKVNFRILDSIANDIELIEARPFSRQGKMVMMLNFIPRGIAKSPDHVIPEQRKKEDLLKDIEVMTARFKNLGKANFSNKVIMDHPRFGGMNAKQWVRFAYVHQHHHLKIVRDIIRRF